MAKDYKQVVGPRGIPVLKCTKQKNCKGTFTGENSLKEHGKLPNCESESQ